MWAAFWLLHRDRPFVPTTIGLPTGGTITVKEPGPIPWTAIDRYARRRRLDGEEFEVLEALVCALDDEWRSWWAEQDHTGGAA